MRPTLQIPEGGDRGRGGRGERGKTSDGPTVASDPPTPTPIVTPLTEPPPPPQPPPGDPPSFLYLLIAGLVLLAALLAWYIYKLRLRMADSGPSLFVSPSAAQAGAVKGLKDSGLDSRKDWKPYLWSGGVLVSPLEPVLVQQIDTADLSEAFYYLVPFGRDLASVRAVACADGVTGEYQECSRFEGGGGGSWGQMFAPWRTAASTRATIMERNIDLHLDAGTTVRPTEIGVHPQLVWKACVESQSVFLPFRLVKVGNSVRYIRLDGVVFDKLS